MSAIVTLAKQWLRRIMAAMNEKNYGVLAAGVAFFSTLAFFPLLVVIVSLTALAVSSEQLITLIGNINAFLPQDVAGLVTAQLNNLVGRPGESIFAAALAFAVALVGIAGAFENIMRALNAAYEVKETRSFVRVKWLSLLLTFGAIGLILVLVPLMGVTSAILIHLGVPPPLAAAIVIGRWLLLPCIIMISLSLLYRYGPNRHPRPKWRLMTPGAIVAMVLWMIVTSLFYVYARYFADFSASYSLFAGIIVLMLWLNLSATVFLIGAEVNGHYEVKRRQARHRAS